MLKVHLNNINKFAQWRDTMYKHIPDFDKNVHCYVTVIIIFTYTFYKRIQPDGGHTR